MVGLPLERFHGHGGGLLEPCDELMPGWTVKQSHVNGTLLWAGPVQKTVDPVHNQPRNWTLDFQHQISLLWLFIYGDSENKVHTSKNQKHTLRQESVMLLWASGGLYWSLRTTVLRVLVVLLLWHTTGDWGPELLNWRETSRTCRNVEPGSEPACLALIYRYLTR